MSDVETKLPSLYQPQSVGELLTSDTISKLLLGFTAGLDWLATALEETGGQRYDLWGKPEKYWCKFCVHFRKALGKEAICHAWDRKVAQVLLDEVAEDYPGQKKEFEGVFHCHAGMLDFAEVIRVGDRPLAVLHGGQLAPKDDASWAQSTSEKLGEAKIGLTTDQINHLIQLALGDSNSVVSSDHLKNRVGLFRRFARELETLLDKLYRQRRHATEEALLHQLACRVMVLDAPAWDALWESLTNLFVELRVATGLSHIEWFMGSEQERFRLTAKTSATPEWGKSPLSLGPFWEDLIHRQGPTSNRRWNAKVREELHLSDDHSCHIYTLICAFGTPSRSIPGSLVLAYRRRDDGVLAEFLPRLAVEITRGVSTVVGEIEKNRITQAAAAQGAYVGHDMKMPLQVLVSVVPAIRLRLSQLNITDANLIARVERLQEAVRSAREKATRLENMPVREFVVQPRKSQSDLVALLDGVINLADGLGTDRGVRVIWASRPDAPLQCELDVRYMLVALHAVLDNAVKYSFRDKRVEVFLDRGSGERAHLRVRNLGVGISPEKHIAIFEFGTRGDVSDQRGGKRQGSGLGLPFAKRIIEAHGGTITVESRSTLNPPPDPDDYLSHVVNVKIRLPLAGRT